MFRLLTTPSLKSIPQFSQFILRESEKIKGITAHNAKKTVLDIE